MTREFVEKKLFDWGFNPGYAGFAYLAGAVCTMAEQGDWISLGQALEPVAKRCGVTPAAARSSVAKLKAQWQHNGTAPAEVVAAMDKSSKTFVSTVYFILRKGWEAERCE